MTRCQTFRIGNEGKGSVLTRPTRKIEGPQDLLRAGEHGEPHPTSTLPPRSSPARRLHAEGIRGRSLQRLGVRGGRPLLGRRRMPDACRALRGLRRHRPYAVGPSVRARLFPSADPLLPAHPRPSVPHPPTSHRAPRPGLVRRPPHSEPQSPHADVPDPPVPAPGAPSPPPARPIPACYFSTTQSRPSPPPPRCPLAPPCLGSPRVY